jgi:hypothetical protein
MNIGVLQDPNFTMKYSDTSSAFLSLESSISWIVRDINNSA